VSRALTPQKAHADPPPLLENSIVSGQYRAGILLAAGGMGLVYAGTHLASGSPVAIKVLRPELAGDPGYLARFEHEARVTASLRGDHVVQALGAGRLEAGLPYFVMERLEGTDLSVVMQHCGPFAAHVATRYAMQAASGLEEAHEIGLVHCDVKPSNLFVAAQRTGASRLRIVDFGVSRWLELCNEPRPGGMLELGSPGYLAPERLLGSVGVDARTDLWSLGVVLFEMLTGRRLFASPTVAETCERVLSARIPSVLDFRPTLQVGLASIVEQCLARNPANRISSAEELRLALLPFAARALPTSESAVALGAYPTWFQGARAAC
jgi:serine/threonine protein kinase